MESKYRSFNPDPDESHEKVLALVPRGGRVLEVGCAAGFLTEKLEAAGCEVLAVEPNPVAAREAMTRARRVHSGYVDEIESLETRAAFDCALVVDVLEHVVERDAFVATVMRLIRDDGTIVFSVPNVGHWTARWAVARGQFPYASHGIFDDTHVRFYTRQTLSQFLTARGLAIREWDVTLGMGEYATVPRWVDRIVAASWYRRKLLRALAKRWPTLFAYQFIVVTERAR